MTNIKHLTRKLEHEVLEACYAGVTVHFKEYDHKPWFSVQFELINLKWLDPNIAHWIENIQLHLISKIGLPIVVSRTMVIFHGSIGEFYDVLMKEDLLSNYTLRSFP